MKRFLILIGFVLFGCGTLFSSFSVRQISSEEELWEALPKTVPLAPSSGSPTQKCVSLFKKLSWMAMDKTALIGVTTLGAWAGAEWAGQKSDVPLVGLSIYLDHDNILNQFNSEERTIFNSPHKNIERIAEILTTRLSRRSGDQMDLWPYLKPLMASSYFSENPPHANVCRHKALILKSFLNQLKIPAKLVTGTIQGDEGAGSHVWVYLPSIDKVADPMNGSLIKRDQYMKTFQAQESFGIIHFAKPIGIMVR